MGTEPEVLFIASLLDLHKDGHSTWCEFPLGISHKYFCIHNGCKVSQISRHNRKVTKGTSCD